MSQRHNECSWTWNLADDGAWFIWNILLVNFLKSSFKAAPLDEVLNIAFAHYQTKILRIFHESHVLGISKKKSWWIFSRKDWYSTCFSYIFEQILGHFPNKKHPSHLEVVCWPPWQSVTSSLNISFWRLVIYSVTLLGCWKHDPSQGIVDRWVRSKKSAELGSCWLVLL